jgi:replicative DNA helicase
VNPQMLPSIDDARRRARSGSPHLGAAPAPVPPGGRVPPHNLEAEEALLGSMMLSRDAIATAVEKVSVDDFYRPSHGHIFDAITTLYAGGEPVDHVTVAEMLRRAGVLEAIGGESVLVSIKANTPATSSAARYAAIVEENALLRRLIGVAGEIAEIGYGLPEDVTAAVDTAESMVFDVAQRRTTDTIRPLKDLLIDSLDHLEALYDRGETITGVPTGYAELDEQLAGLQRSNLVIVGARPSMGKTAFALGMAAHAAMQGTGVLFFSLEMSHLEIAQRMLCAEARVDAARMRNGRLLETDWGKVSNAIGRLSEIPLYVDDNPNITVMDIRAKARRLASRDRLGLVVVDYLQLMSGRSSAENRQVEVSEISRGLKILARELQVPVVALSQLSRNLEARADKRPVLADLRESGCMPADTRIWKADGTSVTLGELVLTQEQPLVLSLDDRWKVVHRRMTKVFPTGVRSVFRLSLASGVEVRATANHPFRKVAGWAPLDELEVGDFIAVPRRIPEPPELTEEVWTDDELCLLAHLIGDGSIGPNGVKYATADPANRDAVTQAAKRLLGVDVTGKQQGNTWLLWFPSPYRLTHGRAHPVRSWLEPHGLWGSRSYNKFVPAAVMAQPTRQIAHFLRHLWATDGSILVGRNGRGPVVTIRYGSTSRRLADDVQALLLRLDIRSRVSRARKKGYRDLWHVTVSAAPNMERFLTLVGCHGARGDAVPRALELVSALAPNPNVDLVPDLVEPMKAALRGSGVTHRALAKGLGEHYCGSYLIGSEDRPRRWSRRRLAAAAEILGNEELAALASSDVCWERVTGIEYAGEEATFDATVEDTHNFVAQGIVAHNSLEQDADVVMFIYRDEVYNPESAERGTAEIIVAKHRNGPTGVASLAFVNTYARFANMARI